MTYTVCTIFKNEISIATSDRIDSSAGELHHRRRGQLEGAQAAPHPHAPRLGNGDARNGLSYQTYGDGLS
jgi:hypothetical protein